MLVCKTLEKGEEAEQKVIKNNIKKKKKRF